jgi:hypothetical protein
MVVGVLSPAGHAGDGFMRPTNDPPEGFLRTWLAVESPRHSQHAARPLHPSQRTAVRARGRALQLSNPI